MIITSQCTIHRNPVILPEYKGNNQTPNPTGAIRELSLLES